MSYGTGPTQRQSAYQKADADLEAEDVKLWFLGNAPAAKAWDLQDVEQKRRLARSSKLQRERMQLQTTSVAGGGARGRRCHAAKTAKAGSEERMLLVWLRRVTPAVLAAQPEGKGIVEVEGLRYRIVDIVWMSK
jgi:hypothetical protein